MPSAAVSTQVRRGDVAEPIGLAQIEQEQEREAQRGDRDRARRATAAARTRPARRAPPPARPGTRCATVAADAGTANSPTTAAAGARPARRRSRGCAASPGLRPAAGSGGSRTARRYSPAGTSIWQIRHSGGGDVLVGRAHARRLLENEQCCARGCRCRVCRARSPGRSRAPRVSTALPPRMTSRNPGSGRTGGDAIQQRVEVAERLPAVREQVLIHHRRQPGPDRRGL